MQQAKGSLPMLMSMSLVSDVATPLNIPPPRVLLWILVATLVLCIIRAPSLSSRRRRGRGRGRGEGRARREQTSRRCWPGRRRTRPGDTRRYLWIRPPCRSRRMRHTSGRSPAPSGTGRPVSRAPCVQYPTHPRRSCIYVAGYVVKGAARVVSHQSAPSRSSVSVVKPCR